MKTKTKTLTLLPVLAAVALLGSCNKGTKDSGNTSNTSTTPTPTSDTKSGKAKISYNDEAHASDFEITITAGSTIDALRVINAGNNTPSFTTSDASVCKVDANNGLLTPIKAGSAVITMVCGDVTIKVTVKVQSAEDAKSKAYSYATASVEERTKILAALEDYAVENYLTGITMFSNGGYVVYNSRYTPPASEYVAGYGWGTMREGKLNGAIQNPKIKTHANYYQQAMSQLPEMTNAMDASGSDVSDIASYMTSAYYGTRLNATGDGYEWVPVLATENCPRPIAIDAATEKKSTAKSSKRWRIYVRTGDNAPKYKMGNTGKLNEAIRKKYDGRKVVLDDYLNAIKFMLTNYNGQYRGDELTDGVSGFAGAAEYFAQTAAKPADKKQWWDEEKWKKYMGSNLFVGSDSEGEYIEFTLLQACTEFYAMYYLSSNLYSPIPREFLDDFGTNIGSGYTLKAAQADGRTNLFAGSDDLTFVDTTLSCGPYYLSEMEKGDGGHITLERNQGYHITSEVLGDGTTRQLYQIPGFDFIKVPSQNSAIRTAFEAGEIDSYGPDKASLPDYHSDNGTLPSGISWTRKKTLGDANFKININATTEAQWKKFFGKNGSVYAHSSDDEFSKYCAFYLSDKNFLDFLSFGMDRKRISESRGSNPTQEYFSDNYLIDPENSVSYNSTDAHKAVLADRYNNTTSPGYNKAASAEALRKAMDETIIPNREKLSTKSSTGTKYTSDNPGLIQIDMQWMNQGDTDAYKDVFDDIQAIADEVMEEYGNAYKFVVNTIDGGADYNETYNKMKRGEFQLGFGAISGGDLNPINFLEVLKSDNSSGFTLNWSKDTSKVDAENPIVYDGKKWSFDGLWNAGNTAAVLDDNGDLANVANVSTAAATASGVKYTSKNSDQTVTYKLSFKTLLQAGAVIKSFAVSNGDKSDSLNEEDIKKITISAPEYDYTIPADLNKDNNGGAVLTATITVNYEITMEDGTTIELSSKLSLPTYAGL